MVVCLHGCQNFQMLVNTRCAEAILLFLLSILLKFSPGRLWAGAFFVVQAVLHSWSWAPKSCVCHWQFLAIIWVASQEKVVEKRTYIITSGYYYQQWKMGTSSFSIWFCRWVALLKQVAVVGYRAGHFIEYETHTFSNIQVLLPFSKITVT